MRKSRMNSIDSMQSRLNKLKQEKSHQLTQGAAADFVQYKCLVSELYVIDTVIQWLDEVMNGVEDDDDLDA